jgi:hypothetical protein
MFHKLVWNKVLILHKILQTITYVTQTTIIKYFWIYLHPEVAIIIAVGDGAHIAG